MSEAVLNVRDLHKSYQQGGNSLRVLRGLNLEVMRGERVAIIGLSGSGKTTLLHLLGGLDTPDQGTVLVNGRNIHDLDEKSVCRLRNHSLGFVYQFHHLLGEFSALENTAMPLLIRGVAAVPAYSSAEEMLSRVGLIDRQSHRPGQLSGGERQRVAIARALVTLPNCVLADEPTGNLDEETAAQVDELMISLSKELAISFVVVTHNLTLASQMDRICRLHNGQLE